MPMTLEPISPVTASFPNVTPERRAVITAAQAMGIGMSEYTIRAVVTTRTIYDTSIEAFGDDDAALQAEAFKPEGWMFGDEGNCGDELVYLLDDKGEHVLQDGIDKRDPGEPFSWTACDIVKAIAALGDDPDTSMLRALAQQARQACTKDG